jgi:hypothetical protein
MRSALTALAAIAATACGTSGASADAGDDYGQPICILQEGGSTYACTGGGTSPACPVNAEAPGSSCAATMAQCMGCEGQTPPSGLGAGFYCICQDAGTDGGLQWSCVGTEHLCK